MVHGKQNNGQDCKKSRLRRKGEIGEKETELETGEGENEGGREDGREMASLA